MKGFLLNTIFNSVIYSLRVVSCFSLLLIGVFVATGWRGTTYFGEQQLHLISQEQDNLEFNYILQKDHIKDANLVPKVIYNQESRYSIRYPSAWENNKDRSTNIMFTGQEGTLSYLSRINIQTIKTPRMVLLPEFVGDLKKNLEKLSNVKYLEAGPISLKLLNGSVVNGEYVVFTFSNNGLAFKQWQVVMPRADGQIFYVWSFVSPIMQYSRDLYIAQAVFHSWNFY